MMDTVVFGKTETGKGRGPDSPFGCPQTDRVRDGRYPCGTSSSTAIIIIIYALLAGPSDSRSALCSPY
jgi:hypothetical protein